MRRDALVARPGKDGKTWFLKVGSTWTNDKGNETLYLECLPLPDKDGKVVIHLRAPLPKEDRPISEPVASRSHDDMSQDIPF